MCFGGNTNGFGATLGHILCVPGAFKVLWWSSNVLWLHHKRRWWHVTAHRILTRCIESALVVIQGALVATQEALMPHYDTLEACQVH